MSRKKGKIKFTLEAEYEFSEQFITQRDFDFLVIKSANDAKRTIENAGSPYAKITVTEKNWKIEDQTVCNYQPNKACFICKFDSKLKTAIQNEKNAQ